MLIDELPLVWSRTSGIEEQNKRERENKDKGNWTELRRIGYHVWFVDVILLLRRLLARGCTAYQPNPLLSRNPQLTLMSMTQVSHVSSE